MNEAIKCPKCKHMFVPSDEQARVMREELDGEYSDKMAKMEREFQSKLKAEAATAQRTGYAKAEEDAQRKQTELEESLSETKARLEKAQSQELVLRKQQRALEDSKAEFEVTMTRKLDEERGKIKEEVGARVAEEFKMKEGTWNTQREGMERLIEDLKRKASQGSTQLQGEALEISVEGALRETFKHDSVEEVAKGVSGADIALNVKTKTGQHVGKIIYELKRVKSFSPGWLVKLREDARAAKADLAILVTTVMPDGIAHVGNLDGVWVSDVASFIGLTQALRAGLVEVSQAKQAQAGRKEKSDEVYDFINSVEFRGRIQGLVEGLIAMKTGIEQERRAYEKLWNKRDVEITRAMTATAGLYGSLQGLIGPSMAEIPQLSLETK